MKRPFRTLLVASAIGISATVGYAQIQVQFKPAPIAQPPIGPDGQPIKEEVRTDEFGFIISDIAKKKLESVKGLVRPDLPANDWADIIGALQGLLDDPSDKLVEIEKVGPAGRKKLQKVSVRGEVTRIIGALPPNGLDFYRREVGPGADQKLKDALERSDYRLLKEVSDRFFHTKAGAEATAMLGWLELDRGRYASAGDVFKRLLERNPAETPALDVLFWSALANARLATDAAQRKDELERRQYDSAATKHWDRLRKELGNNKELTLGSRKFTIAQLEGELTRVVAMPKKVAQDEVYVARGNYTNNAQGVGGRPFLEPAWQFGMLETHDEDAAKFKAGMDWIKQTYDGIAGSAEKEQRALPIPGFHPIASAGKVVFRSYDSLYCLATRDDPSQVPPVVAGEMLWRTNNPCEGSLFTMVDKPGHRAMMDQQWKGNYAGMGPKTVFIENALIGSPTHDGKNVYFVDDIAVPPHPQYLMQFGFNGQQMQFGPYTDIVNSSKLCALELNTGLAVWTVGGKWQGPRKAAEPNAKETTESLLFDCFFLSAPLPHGGKLYVVIEKDREQRLVCLDPSKTHVAVGYVPRDGSNPPKVPDLVWSQPLGSPNVPLPMDSLRRIQGMNLAYGDNILIVPTNAGAVFGIDLLSHSIVWATSYRTATPSNLGDGEIQPGGLRRRPVPVPSPNGVPSFQTDHWRAAAPIVSGNKVIFTAYDSNTLMCISLRDGELLWEKPRMPDDLYVAGIFDDRVMVVGKSQSRFLDINKNGDRIGDPIDQGGVPTGVGTASKDVYFLPVKATRDGNEPSIVSIDVKKGEKVAVTRSRKKIPAGNLIFFDGSVFSQSATHVTSYPQLDVKVREMEARLKKNADDPIGLAAMGDLYLDDGKLSEAIATLQKCLRNKPDDLTRARAREKLYDAITEHLQRDFNLGEPYLDEYRELCTVAIPEGTEGLKKQQLQDEERRRKSNFFAIVAKGKESQGKLVEAFENYLAFGAFVGQKDQLVSVVDQPSTYARPDVWARARINAMMEKATPAQRKPLEAKAAVEWEQIKATNDVEKLRGFVRVFGNRFASGAEARLALAEKLLQTSSDEENREAENLLFSLRAGSDEQAAARAVEALARLFVRKGLLEDAVGMFAELGKNYPNVVVNGKTGADSAAALYTDKRFLAYLEPIRFPWSTARMKATETNTVRNQQQQQSFTIEPDGEALPFFQRHRVMIDMNYASTGKWAVKLFDRQTGEERFRSPPIDPPQYIHNWPQTNNHRFAQIHGHTLYLNVLNQRGYMVQAYDLADRKLLWDYNLFGKIPMPQNPNGNPAWFPLRTEIEGDGVRLHFSDGWSHKAGHMGVMESSYVCLVTRDGLVALDPAKGTVLWTKTNVSGRVQLIGDEDYIFLFESTADGQVSAARAIRAQDGVEIPIKDYGAVFESLKKSRTFGRKMLIVDDSGPKKSMRLYDILTGKDDWKREVEGSVRLLRSEDPSILGYVTEQGKVSVMRAKDGKEMFTSQLDKAMVARHLDKVEQVVLFADRDRYYVALNRPTDARNNNMNQQLAVTMGIRTIKVNGTVYCFDRASGKRLWYTDEQFENQQIVMEQFQDLPILVGIHNYAKFDGPNFVGNGMRLIALQKTSGKAIYMKDVPMNGWFHALVTDPKNSTVELLRHDLQIRFSPMDEKKP